MKTYRLRVFYKKEGISRFISHLSFCKLIERVLRRLNIPVKFSSGFTPHMKISFGPPLPIPVEGINEFFEIEVEEVFDINDFIKRCNEILPEGVVIKNCYWVDKKYSQSSIYAIYTIPLNQKILKENIEKFGRIIKEEENYIKVIFKLENFNHRKVFVGGLFDGIKREIIIENNG
ncbi:MAG: TIGR03936 family radical SAM-associated protein [Candidatus Omnitrophica bacterium]|nr:TIGR03936 family radical SAM-associated protein [Candidatus Omnitrophota bacterium]MCM8806985.1 TIGR03936 family radical SAM-associated protein [Candidatus Omnitrophota bacterium]